MQSIFSRLGASFTGSKRSPIGAVSPDFDYRSDVSHHGLT